MVIFVEIIVQVHPWLQKDNPQYLIHYGQHSQKMHVVFYQEGNEEERGTAMGHLPLSCRHLGLKQSIKLPLQHSRI